MGRERAEKVKDGVEASSGVLEKGRSEEEITEEGRRVGGGSRCPVAHMRKWGGGGMSTNGRHHSSTRAAPAKLFKARAAQREQRKWNALAAELRRVIQTQIFFFCSRGLCSPRRTKHIPLPLKHSSEIFQSRKSPLFFFERRRDEKIYGIESKSSR